MFKKLLPVLISFHFALLPANADTLKAGIEVDDGGFRENVLNQLEVGKPFDSESIPKTPGDVFTELPPWMPGNWICTEVTIITPSGRATRPAAASLPLGGVVDKYGRPWMRCSVPSICRTDLPGGDYGYSVSYPIRFLLNDDSSKYTQDMDSVKFVVKNGLIAGIEKRRTSVDFNQFRNQIEQVTKPEKGDYVAVRLCDKISDIEPDDKDQAAFAVWAKKIDRADLIP